MENKETQPNKNLFTLKNIILAAVVVILTLALYLMQSGNFFKASLLDMGQVPAFNGTVFPINKTLDWVHLTSQEYTNFKSGDLTYENAGSKLINIMDYDPTTLCNTDPTTLGWTGNDLTIRNLFLTYVTVYIGKYTSGAARACEGEGSHPAIDIRAPKLTPIISIANGMVTKISSGGSSGNGNAVCIAHPNVPSYADPNVKVTYKSCYLHLDTIASGINVGTIVTKGQEIGKVGLTGITTTYHLHFQLDKDNAPYDPYWPFTSAEAQAAGCNFFECVNQGLGKENAILYTENPMMWVQKYTNYNQTAMGGTTTNPPQNNVNTVQPNQNTSTSTNANTATPNSNAGTVNANTTIPPANVNSNPPANTNSTTSPASFSDVTSSTHYGPEIMSLVGQGILSGYPDGTFKPSGNVKRAEAAKMLAVAFHIQTENNPNTAQFSDIDTTQWYYKYVNALFIKLILKGYPDGTFKPENEISRAEFVKMLFESNGKPLQEMKVACDDLTTVQWFTPYADNACQKKLLDFDNNLFEPTKTVSRAEAAAMTDRLLKAQ